MLFNRWILVTSVHNPEYFICSWYGFHDQGEFVLYRHKTKPIEVSYILYYSVKCFWICTWCLVGIYYYDNLSVICSTFLWGVPIDHPIGFARWWSWSRLYRKQNAFYSIFIIHDIHSKDHFNDVSRVSNYKMWCD